MKTLLFLLLIAVAASSVNSQENIKADILSYSDSTKLLISNGRRLIVDKTLAGQHKEALATLNYLKQNMDKRYVILYPAEELYLSLATRNFPLFLYNARNFNTLLDGKTRTVIYENIAPDIQSYLENELHFIIEDLDNYRMQEEDRELIRIFIRYFMNDEVSDLNRTIRDYQNRYPNTDYSFFLNEINKKTTTGRMNFVIGNGSEFLNGYIAEAFGSRLQVMNLELDGFINQLYLSMFLGGSIVPVYSSMNLPVKNRDLLHSKEEKVNSLKYGVKAGKILYSSQKLDFYPFLSLGGYEMNSQSLFTEEKDSSTSRNNLTGSFYAGFGAAGDIILKKWQSKSIHNPAGSLFLRVQTGCDRFFSQKEHTGGYDYYFMLSLGLGLGTFY